MPCKFKGKRSHYYRRCLVEVLLFTDVARGYCYNNQASRRRNQERPPEPAKALFVLQPRSGRSGCVCRESFRRERFEPGRRGMSLCVVQVPSTRDAAAPGSGSHWGVSAGAGGPEACLVGAVQVTILNPLQMKRGSMSTLYVGCL